MLLPPRKVDLKEQFQLTEPKNIKDYKNVRAYLDWYLSSVFQ